MCTRVPCWYEVPILFRPRVMTGLLAEDPRSTADPRVRERVQSCKGDYTLRQCGIRRLCGHSPFVCFSTVATTENLGSLACLDSYCSLYHAIPCTLTFIGPVARSALCALERRHSTRQIGSPGSAETFGAFTPVRTLRHALQGLPCLVSRFDITTNLARLLSLLLAPGSGLVSILRSTWQTDGMRDVRTIECHSLDEYILRVSQNILARVARCSDKCQGGRSFREQGDYRLLVCVC